MLSKFPSRFYTTFCPSRTRVQVTYCRPLCTLLPRKSLPIPFNNLTISIYIAFIFLACIVLARLLNTGFHGRANYTTKCKTAEGSRCSRRHSSSNTEFTAFNTHHFKDWRQQKSYPRHP